MLRAGVVPQRVRGSHRIRVESDAVGDSSRASAAIAEMHGHRFVGVPRQHPHRRLATLRPRRLNLDHVAGGRRRNAPRSWAKPTRRCPRSFCSAAWAFPGATRCSTWLHRPRRDRDGTQFRARWPRSRWHRGFSRLAPVFRGTPFRRSRRRAARSARNRRSRRLYAGSASNREPSRARSGRRGSAGR